MGRGVSTYMVLSMLYKELHYRILKTNVLVAEDEKKMRRQLRHSGNLLTSVGLQSLTYLFLGSMMALSISMAKGTETKAVLFSSYCMFPFILAIYTSTLNSSYVVSMGVFEPLKPLPLKTTPVYLSLLTLIDGVPGFMMVLPPVISIGTESLSSGLLALGWGLMALFMGHTLGLMIYSHFGTSVRVGGGRLGFLKNMGKVIIIMVVMGVFYVARGVSGYVSRHVATFASLTAKYFVAFPFSASTVYTPLKSLVVLIPYALAFSVMYIVTLRRLFRGIQEPSVISGEERTQGGADREFRTVSAWFAVYVKDMRTLFRRSQLLAAFLLPFYFIIPQLFGGRFATRGGLTLILMASAFSVLLVGASLKLDGRGMELMNSLPLMKRTYVMGKILTLVTFPVLSGLTVALLTVYYNGFSSLPIVPCAFLLPFMSACISMARVSRVMGKSINMPEMNMMTYLAVFLLISVPYTAVGISFFLLGGFIRWVACYSVALISLYAALMSIR